MKSRAEAETWLKADPKSYLAAVQRVNFDKNGTLSVGSAENSDVRLEDPSIRPHHLFITVQNDKFKIEAVDAGSEFMVGKGTEAAPTRAALVAPSSIRVGRFTLRFSHGGYPAVIVFDPKSPRLKDYHGIKYFPIDLSYRFVLKLIADPLTEPVAVASSLSAERRAVRMGWFEFTLAGKAQRLAAYRWVEPGANPEALTVLFRDGTTGKESYSVGRYLDPEKQSDGQYVLDFNMAYNPACAFSNYYNCPIPPQENRMKVPIRAGEKDSHYH